MLIFAYGKNLRKLLSREAGINRRNAPTKLLNSSTFFAGTQKISTGSNRSFFLGGGDVHVSASKSIFKKLKSANGASAHGRLPLTLAGKRCTRNGKLLFRAGTSRRRCHIRTFALRQLHPRGIDFSTVDFQHQRHCLANIYGRFPPAGHTRNRGEHLARHAKIYLHRVHAKQSQPKLEFVASGETILALTLIAMSENISEP